MAPVKTKAKEPAESAPSEASMQTVEAVVAAATEPEQPIVLPKTSVPETPAKPKLFRVKLLKNYRPYPPDMDGACVMYEIVDPLNSDPEDFTAPRKERPLTTDEWKKVPAGRVIGLQMEEAKTVMRGKIATRFDDPNI